MIDERSKPAFQALSNTNKGPLVIVASYIFLISSSLAVVIKIWTRLSTARKLIWTDWAMLAAIVRLINPRRIDLHGKFRTDTVG